MVLLNRSELMARLKENIVLVSFLKVNGEPRQMRATLIQSYIPNFDVKNHVDSNRNLLEDSGIVNVWDVDAGGWRSFLLERVNWTMCPAPASVLTPAPVPNPSVRPGALRHPSAIEAALRD